MIPQQILDLDMMNYTKDLSHIPKGEDLVGYGKKEYYMKILCLM